MKLISNMLIITAAFMFWSCSGTTESTDNQQDATEHQMDDATTDAADSAEKKKPASPKQQAMAMVGKNHIHIEYSAPSVRGRVIWGGLVPYGKVWSTGAHNATSINFPEAVIISGTEIPAGKYGFFTIPSEEKWTVILNQNWDMHLADDYQDSQDIIRFEITPEKLNEIQEALVYKVESTGDNTGSISMAWEYIKISFEVTNQ